MAQFDVYQNLNKTKDTIPYLLDVQNELLDPLATCVVVPLVRAEKMGKPVKGLNPTFVIETISVVMSTPQLAGVPRKILGKKIDSLQDHHQEIIAALDLLFTGI